MARQLRPRHPTTGLAFRPELGRFGVLPRELRDQIYSYLYGGWRIYSIATSGGDPDMITNPAMPTSFTGITSTFVNDDDDSSRPGADAIMDSLLVSRRFFEEVAHILYSTNRFSFKRPGVLKMFLDQIAEGHRHSITKLHLDCDKLTFFGSRRYWWEWTMQAVVRLHGIKYLTISSTMEDYPTYHEPDEVRDRVLEVRESKLFPKLELATIQWYCGKDERVVLETYLEELQRFFAGEIKLG
jgi:hypothetical protein